MPHNSETTKIVRTYVPNADYVVIEEVAAEEKIEVAELIRRALRQYMKRKGKNIRLEMKRGGIHSSKAARLGELEGTN